MPLESPKRCATRNTCVSTAIAGSLNAILSTIYEFDGENYKTLYNALNQ